MALRYSVPVGTHFIEVKMRIGPKQNVDLLGRVVALTEVGTIFKAPRGR